MHDLGETSSPYAYLGDFFLVLAADLRALRDSLSLLLLPGLPRPLLILILALLLTH